MATWTNKSKNTSTFLNKLRKSKEPSIDTMQSYKFTDTPFGGSKELKDFTFEELQTTEWTNKSKTLREAGFDVSRFDAALFDDEGGYDNVWITEERN